jgi:N-acetyl-anhydromuramyl-L-alanine amidase AmpD
MMLLAVASMLISATVIPRVWWDEDEAPRGLRDRTRPITHLVVHHTGIDVAVGPLELKRYHQQVRRFGDIGYHFVVTPDGTIYEGRPLDKIGAHAGVVAGQNRRNHRDPDEDSVGIVLDGNFDFLPPPWAQLQATAALLADLRARFSLPATSIVLHRGVKALVEERGHRLASDDTVCPGEAAASFLPFLRVFSVPKRPPIRHVKKRRMHHIYVAR